MECIGTHQVVGDICTFTCDKDYVLSGSESRECLPNTTWSGMTTTCSVIQCPELIPSDHSVIVSPCSSDINSTCLLACEPGYYSEGIFVHQQSCKYNSEGIVDWTLPPLCSGNGLQIYIIQQRNYNPIPSWYMHREMKGKGLYYIIIY